MKKKTFGYRKYGKQLCAVALAVIAVGLTQSVSAEEWVPNTPESIVVAPGATSYQLKHGDTLWAVGQAIGADVNLLAKLSNVDLAAGEQYRLPIGYTVKWTADKSTYQLANPEGDIVNEVQTNDVVPTSTNSSVESLKLDLAESLESRVKEVKVTNGISHVVLKDGESMSDFTKDLATLQELEKEAESVEKGGTDSVKDGSSTEPKEEVEVPKTEETTEPAEEVEQDNSGADKLHFLRRFNEGSDMILVESNGLYGLVDVGYRNSATRDYALSYLNNLGIKEFEFVYVTHYDEDHIVSIDAYTGGTQGGGDVKRNDTMILDNFKVKQVYLPENITGASYEKGYVNNIKKTLEERGIAYITEGDFTLGDFVMTTYNDKPFTEEEKSFNNGQMKANYSSRALLVEKDNYDVLLAGDVESYDEQTLGKEVTADTGTVDVLKAGHHGYSTSNKAEFLGEIQPEAIVVTASKSKNSPAEQHNLTAVAPTYWTGSDTVVVDMSDTSEGITIGTEKNEYQTIVNDSTEGTRLNEQN